MRDELVLKVGRDRTNVEDEMAVNDMYLDAITAKLKLLDRIWSVDDLIVYKP